MSRDRDVDSFDRRAGSYERDWRAGFHQMVVARGAEVALDVAADPATCSTSAAAPARCSAASPSGFPAPPRSPASTPLPR
jgi:hypothetical protein